MATEFSFDVVSKLDMTEVKNAIDLVSREIESRYDFRGSKASLTLDDETVKAIADNQMQLDTLLDVLRARFAKRGLSLKGLEYGKVEAAAGGTLRQIITLKQGIPTEEAKKLAKRIKESGIKVQTQIQGDELRVTGKDKDALQAVQGLIAKMEDLPYDVAYANYR
jgi:uncharacterized protein YajQ (UPF0234 family)